jgi:MarR family transcriptional regulator, organic hydroperoxide resistance regulator
MPIKHMRNRSSIGGRAKLLAELTRAVRLFIAGSSLYSQRVAEKLDVHPTDLQFFNILELLGPITPAVLARMSGLSSGGVTVVLDRLERAGYVMRKPNPEDRRSVLIYVLSAKRKTVVANYRSVEAQFHRLLADFSGSDLETILRFFAAAAAQQR